jgi:hypothetical protein
VRKQQKSRRIAMGYYSTISGEITAPTKEIRNEIIQKIEDEDLFSTIDLHDDTNITLWGEGKYYDQWMVPFYELCASLGCEGCFERTGESFGDMEQVDIYPGKIERRYATLPDPGKGEIIEVPLAEEKPAKEKTRPRTTGPGL